MRQRLVLWRALPAGLLACGTAPAGARHACHGGIAGARLTLLRPRLTRNRSGFRRRAFRAEASAGAHSRHRSRPKPAPEPRPGSTPPSLSHDGRHRSPRRRR